MSGGVDSSVAAHLLLDAGHDVVGVFMRHSDESSAVCKVDDQAASTSLPVLGGMASGRADHKQGCCTASDAADARRVATKMDIPFYALDLTDDFRRIVDYFVDDYLTGRTPNPCVRCNQWIKFGRLFDYADGIDAEFVATGHYARMEKAAGVNQLHRGLDSNKDQSYALFGIRRDRLDRMLLPVGGFEKPRIREIAEGLGLGVAGKKDSQEICFVTQGHHSDFVRARDPKRSANTDGEIVTTEGKVVGRHAGYEAFTVGQRKKLGVAMGEPYFVVRIEPDTRRVVIGRKESLERDGLTAGEANWLVDVGDVPQQVSVQIRYNGSPKPGTISIDPDSPDRFAVRFDQPELAVAPGQAAVVYDGTRVIGGGWIE
ncbi:tRNA-specific 2-thiouridylase MnmA [Rubripirellula tenax]|uniref:tRNA-specific 2-thiouridylase MnmA n=2 Tax=Rubripirellula tenax TaxID=2528015 RepID=A0A5C6FGY3_9BACT|nr:tRNA-specific 2-thiouridylase MnmA [Rubripirellula tenax]